MYPTRQQGFGGPQSSAGVPVLNLLTRIGATIILWPRFVLLGSIYQLLWQ